jgi:cell division protein FtsB
MPFAHVRWDRVSRVALLCVLVVIAFLYVGPARSYWHALGQSRAERAEVRALRAEHARLQARFESLQKPGTLEREARKLGYVMPGEKAYVVQGLPDR